MLKHLQVKENEARKKFLESFPSPISDNTFMNQLSAVFR